MLINPKQIDAYNIPISQHGEMYQKILDKSKLVLNNPVNLRHTKLDKSKLVLNNL